MSYDREPIDGLIERSREPLRLTRSHCTTIDISPVVTPIPMSSGHTGNLGAICNIRRNDFRNGGRNIVHRTMSDNASQPHSQVFQDVDTTTPTTSTKIQQLNTSQILKRSEFKQTCDIKATSSGREPSLVTDLSKGFILDPAEGSTNVAQDHGLTSSSSQSSSTCADKAADRHMAMQVQTLSDSIRHNRLSDDSATASLALEDQSSDMVSSANIDVATKRSTLCSLDSRLSGCNQATVANASGRMFTQGAKSEQEASTSSASQPEQMLQHMLSRQSDTNNNRDREMTKSTSPRDSLANMRQSNFSKSASGSRLVSRGRSAIVCDCLSRDCEEKEHSTRRQFIEHYYNSRTCLKTDGNSASLSSFNVSTPLNKLGECDAITKRLLSSPIRASSHQSEYTVEHRLRMTDAEKTRRASLGTTNTTMTEKLYSRTSPIDTQAPLANQRRDSGSADTSYEDVCENRFMSLQAYPTGVASKHETDNMSPRADKCSSEDKSYVHKSQHHQARSLSVCDEESLKPKFKNISNYNSEYRKHNYHSSNLNRAISLACDTVAKSSRHCTARKFSDIIPLFGCDMKSLDQFNILGGSVLPPVIDSACNHILEHGIDSIGIFRKSGVKSRILNLRRKIEADQYTNFDDINRENEYSIYDIADLVKMWYRELRPTPIMTKDMIKLIIAFLDKTKVCDVGAENKYKFPLSSRVNTSQQESLPSSCLDSRSTGDDSFQSNLHANLVDKLYSSTSSTHRAVLLKAFNFLSQISSRSDTNQMTSHNLAICLTPSLCATESDQSSILSAQRALEFCIDKHHTLFRDT